MNRKLLDKLGGTVVILIVLGMAMSACTTEVSQEEEIRQFVVQAVALGEARDVSGISGIIAEDYRDPEQRTHRDLLRLTMGYFLRNKNIHLFSRIASMEFPGPGRARLQLNIAMAGQPMQNLESLLNIRAELMTFDLDLTRQHGDWLVQSARWRRATMADFSGKDLQV